MESLPRRTATRERLRNYSPAIVTELLGESQGSLQAARWDPGDTLDNYASGASQYWERVQAQRAAREAEVQARELKFQAAMERKKQEEEQRRESEFQKTYAEVLAGLSNETGIMGDTRDTLSHKAKIKAQKQADLHQEWTGEVFEKIQGRLQREVSRRSHRSIEQRLKSQMDDYLRTTNAKIGVFRDVIIEDDYNPLTARNHTIRIPTGDMSDPLKRDVLKGQHERALMGLSASADSLPPGKVTLDNKVWGALHIHATPYGHCVDESGAYVVRPLSATAVNARKSRIPFDHYDYPNKDNAAAAADLGRMGKAMPPGPEQLRGRRGIMDVMQQTCHLNPGFTGGDLWLEAKGKANAPGPEMRRGRPDLTEILHQTSNPYKDKRTLGDQWLEAKGKAKAPGPEERHGRADLTEILQQTSNPYKDGRSLGDQWLEAKGKAAAEGPKSTVQEFINRCDAPPDAPKPRDPTRYVSVLVNDRTLHPNK